MQHVTRRRLTAARASASLSDARTAREGRTMPWDPGSPTDTTTRVGPLIQAYPSRVLVLLGISAAGWLFLVWLAVDMGTPFAQLAMPMSRNWSAANLLAVWIMWSVMMVAMMLPSALPMILTFVQVAQRTREHARARAFVAAYVLVWLGFATVSTAAQWVMQALHWVDPMAVSRSALLTALLLVIAGVYQFSPLKLACLSACRAPLSFLLGGWRSGVGGAFAMGLRHGMLCLGCCWALMALLFVGGVMNVAWVAALALAVAIEKLAPGGRHIGALFGWGLIAAGVVKLLVMAN
jgi:predicted metal-binding membrane protein